MKIIQFQVIPIGTGVGKIGFQFYGLGDDGEIYMRYKGEKGKFAWESLQSMEAIAEEQLIPFPVIK